MVIIEQVTLKNLRCYPEGANNLGKKIQAFMGMLEHRDETAADHKVILVRLWVSGSERGERERALLAETSGNSIQEK